jgi:hypothetical protein
MTMIRRGNSIGRRTVSAVYAPRAIKRHRATRDEVGARRAALYNIVCVDVEIFPNFALVGVLDLSTGQTHTFSTEAGIGDTLDAFRKWYDLHSNCVWVGFNSVKYDNFILKVIIDGGVANPFVNGSLTDVLYTYSGTLINGPEWRQQKSVNGEICVDFLAMNGGAKKQVGSLKEAACKLDAPSLRTLPYAPDHVLTRDEMLDVAAYNKTDLLVTARVADAQREKMLARLALGGAGDRQRARRQDS